MNPQYPQYSQYSEYPQYQGLYYDDYYWPNDPYHSAFQPPLTDTNYWLNYSDVTPLEPPAIYNCDWLDHPNEIQTPVLQAPAPRPISTSSLSSSFSVADSLALVNDDYPFNSNPSGEIQPPAVAIIDERPIQPQYQQQHYLPDYNTGYYSSAPTNSYNSSSSTTETTPPSGENVQPISMQLETRREGGGPKASNNSNKPTKKYKCNYDDCRFSSSKSGNLKTHLRTHTGERPFKCEWEGCDEKFTQSGNLKTHLRTHTGEKPFECSWKDCDQKFADPSALKGHYRTHTGEKPFKCGWEGCGLKFAQSENLKRHLSYHTRNGPFKCQLCGCSFFNAGSFSNHMICHTSHDGESNTSDKENQVDEMVDNKDLEKQIDEQSRKRSRDAMTEGDASEEEEEEEMPITSKPKRQSTLRQIDYSQFF